jgi:hypothetical protein
MRSTLKIEAVLEVENQQKEADNWMNQLLDDPEVSSLMLANIKELTKLKELSEIQQLASPESYTVCIVKRSRIRNITTTGCVPLQVLLVRHYVEIHFSRFA